MNILANFVKQYAYELKKDFFEVEDRINSESGLEQILGWHDIEIAQDLISINTSLRLLNWFNDYLSQVFSDYKPYMFEYLDYKKALGRKGLEYISNFQNKTYEQINNLINNLISRDDNKYQISFIINNRSELIARMIEKLRLSISIKPEKVSSSYYNVKHIFEWFNENMDWLIVDPTKYKDPQYISYLIDRVNSHMSQLFVSEGKLAQNSFNTDKKI